MQKVERDLVFYATVLDFQSNIWKKLKKNVLKLKWTVQKKHC